MTSSGLKTDILWPQWRVYESKQKIWVKHNYLILIACQFVSGYLCLEAFIVHSYWHYLYGCFLRHFRGWIRSYQIWIVFLEHQLLLINGTPTDTTTLGQSGAGSNSNKEVLHTSQNWSFIIRYSLVSYPEHSFLEASYPNQDILSPTNKGR